MNYKKGLLIRIVLLLIIPYGLFKIIIYPITKYLVYYINLPFFDISLNGSQFMIEGFTLDFITACAAITAYYLLFLLLITTKNIKLIKFVKIFFLGSLIILLANISRIEILFYLLTNYGINTFDKVHVLFWDVLSTIIVAGTWIFLVYHFKIKNVPVYSDIKTLIKEINDTKRN